MRMRIAELWASLVLLGQGWLMLASSQYMGPFLGQQQQQQQRAARLQELAYSGKRASSSNLAEPTCEELRAMWRYSKRQSRAAESSNELPVYRDPFSYNVWEAYPTHTQNSAYRAYEIADEYRNVPATSRHGGGAPIYGKLVEAPPRQRLRNGKFGQKGFEDITRYYGTLNREPPSRDTIINSRMPGGIAKSMPRQAGRFQTLKNMILEERAKELKEQRKAEDMAARAAALKEMTFGDRRQPQQQQQESSNPNIVSSLVQDPKSDYLGAEDQYIADVPELQQTLGKSYHFKGREYMLR